MIDAILAFSIRQRWMVIVAVLGIAGLGAWNFTRLPIDAVPDITNVQVQINSSAPGYSPLEVEQRITFPVETAMGGLPRLSYTRSLSRYGLSQVTVVFEDGTDIYFARQLVNERIQQVKDQLPVRHRDRDGPDLDRTGRNLPIRGREQARREEAGRHRLHADRPEDHPGLDHQAAAAHRPGRRRAQLDRRLRTPVPRAARPDAADGLPAELPRRDDGARRQQCQRRRRLHRAQRRAVHRAHAGPGRHHGGDPRRGDRVAPRRAGADFRRGGCARGHRAAHRRRHDEWRGGRARRRDAADRREQPHRLATRGGTAERGPPFTARRRDGARGL